MKPLPSLSELIAIDPAPARVRVTVLCGGPSAERTVSLQSGEAVAAALRRCGHEVFVADIGPDDLSALDHPCDVIFPALHGTFGEDGTLQRLLADRGIRFVGSGPEASALAMDKVATKERLTAAGVPTPKYEVWNAEMLAQGAERQLSLPVIVKPVDQGSSVATAIVRTGEEFRPAVQAAVAQFGRALVEQFIPGAELTVGLLAGTPLPPIRIQPRRNFYDFTAKYEDDATEYLFETGYSGEFVARVQAWSVTAFDTLGCRHLARVDWMIDAEERAWFLEVNTLPGFTSHSLVPKAAVHIGLPFDRLCDRLVQLAWRETG